MAKVTWFPNREAALEPARSGIGDTAAMSPEDLEAVRNMGEALNQGGMASALRFFDEAAVFEEPPEQPGATVAHGISEIERLYKQFDESWEEHRSEPEEIRVLDADRVLVLSVEHFRGRDGLEVSQPCGTVFTVRHGKITRMQSFWERGNALVAAGL